MTAGQRGSPIQILLVEDSSDEVFFMRETLREEQLCANLSVVRDGVPAEGRSVRGGAAP